MERVVARHRIKAFIVALAVALLAAGLVAGGAAAPAGAHVSPAPVVIIHSAGGLSPDGRSITMQVLASCPVRWTVVRAVVAVAQPQAAGEASFSFPCIGSLRGFTVVVPAATGTFVLGDAQATAFVTIQRGKTATTQASELVDVQPSVLVDLADTARLESGGGAAVIDVTVACPVGVTPEESYVNVAQGQTAQGTQTYFPICDGSPHVFTLRVQASQGVFQAGSGRALTFAVVSHEGFATAGVDDIPVQIVG
jgi:hypothetical protein